VPLRGTLLAQHQRVERRIKPCVSVSHIELICVTFIWSFNMPTRPLWDQGYLGTNFAFSGGASYSSTQYFKDFRGMETLISDGHAWPRRRSDFNPDIGGPFEVLRTKFELLCPNIDAHYFYGGSQLDQNGWGYTGQVCPDSLNRIGAAPENLMDLTREGTTGWARFKPSKPHAGVSTFIGELKDLPTLPTLLSLKSRAKFFKSLGHNYLNVEFGWKPFVNDLRKYFNALANSQKILQQLARDNGRPVRRSGQVDTSSTTSESRSVGYFTTPTWPSYLYGDDPQYKTIKDTLITTYWFSGQFRYYIPLGKSALDLVHRDLILNSFVFGIEGTPRVIYELIPWSWAVDWVSNLGDIMSNLSDDFLSDGLVADYAYIMGNQKFQRSWSVDGTFKRRTYFGVDVSETVPFTTTLTETQEIKSRGKATPYGFGLDFSSFSPRQLAILAALGFTRLR
jgi:hypothetical protein